MWTLPCDRDRIAVYSRAVLSMRCIYIVGTPSTRVDTRPEFQLDRYAVGSCFARRRILRRWTILVESSRRSSRIRRG